MTPQARVAAALSVLLLVAGCGGDTTPTVTAAASAGASINLRAADLPTGFTGDKHQHDTSTDAGEKEFLACVGATSTDPDKVRELFSDDFSKAASQVSGSRSPPTSPC